MKIDFLKTDKKESFKTWRFRTLMNWYPMYFGTGGKILFWSDDSKEVHLRLKLSLWTYNYVGTIFGGSMFAASDPFYMIMLMNNLGKDYVVWDKSAQIRFRKPAKQTLYAKYTLDTPLLDSIRQEIAEKQEIDKIFRIQWVDKNGVVYSEIERACYIANKEFYQQKKGFVQTAKFA
jgi:hypothetical protein